MTPRERNKHAEALDAVRSQLREEAFERAWQEEKALTIQQAMALVREEMRAVIVCPPL